MVRLVYGLVVYDYSLSKPRDKNIRCPALNYAVHSDTDFIVIVYLQCHL